MFAHQAAAAHYRKILTLLILHAFLSGFPLVVLLNNIQSYKWSEQGHSPLYLEAVHQCKMDSGGFPAGRLVQLSAGVSSEQSQGRVLPSLSKRWLSTVTFNVKLKPQGLNIKHTCNTSLATVYQSIVCFYHSKSRNKRGERCSSWEDWCLGDFFSQESEFDFLPALLFLH